MTEVLPTLSTSGWVNGVQEKADRLLSYFISSQFSQSYVYNGSISSLPYLIQKNGHSIGNLREDLTGKINQLYSSYFDNATVEVEIIPIDENNSSLYNIRLSLVVAANGVNYSLGRLIEVSNSTIKKITDIQ